MSEPHATPPRLAERLVEWSLPEADREVVLGDFQEEFAATADRVGRAAAIRGYLWQAARSVGSNLIRRRRELLDRHRVREAEDASALHSFTRTYSTHLDLLIVVALVLMVSFSMNFWLLLLVPPAAVMMIARAILWNPTLPPGVSQLEKERRARRVHLNAALLLPANVLMSPIFGRHDLARAAMSIALALVISQCWPHDRWPIARAADPAEPDPHTGRLSNRSAEKLRRP